MRFLLMLTFVVGIIFQVSGQSPSPTFNVSEYGVAEVIQPSTNQVWLAKPKKDKKSNIEKKVKAHGPKNKSKHLVHLDLVRLEIDNPDLLESLREDVEYLEPDSPVFIDATPTDPMWPQQWDMANIFMPSAWEKTQGNEDIIVAVFDTGIDLTHPDLVNSLYPGWQCIGGLMAVGGNDDNGHGSHVAGAIGATANNGIGIAGMNWKLKLMPMKFLDQYGSGWTSDILTLLDKAVELRANGINIRIGNNSWGGSGSQKVLQDAFQKLEDSGILSICASGNSGQDIDVYPFQPAGLPNLGIVSVLASDQANVLADFSNYGFVCTDVAAPGVSTLSTVPTNTNYQYGSASGYRTLSGTSMATPHVSGLAALTLALNPNQSVYELKNTLLNSGSTDEMSDMGWLSTTGAKINAQKTLNNPLVMSPKTNNPPRVYDVKNYDVSGGKDSTISFSASDPEGNMLRFLTVDRFNRTASLTNFSTFKTENRFLSTTFPFFVGASDKNGGSDSSNVFLNVYHDASTFKLQDYKIGYSATNEGKDLMTRTWLVTNSDPTKDVYFKPYVTGKGFNGWNNNWILIGSGFTTTYRGFLDTNASYMVKSYTYNYQLAPHEESDRVILRLGTDVTNTMPFPNLSVRLDKISGLNPLKINFFVTNTVNLNTNNLFYVIGDVGICGNCNQVKGSGSYFNGTITYSENGIHQLAVLVQDFEHANNWDVKEWKVSVLAPTNSPPSPPPIVILNPVSISVSQNGNDMLLKWVDTSTGEDRYEVESTWKKNGPFPPFQKVATLSSNAQYYAYPSGIKNNNYQFRVRAAAGNKVAPWSNIASIRFK